jgi:hypothetical protein
MVSYLTKLNQALLLTEANELSDYLSILESHSVINHIIADLFVLELRSR